MNATVENLLNVGIWEEDNDPSIGAGWPYSSILEAFNYIYWTVPLWTVHFFTKGSEPDTENKNRTLVKFEFQINSKDAFSINMFLVIFGTYLY